ncbi:hypothetical protein SEPCBS57363_000138 [Sporothrix epigloea]|uniref:Uncharacterized protein n=1 Tax=Sporothrix epigloea TaxID=1892477 RepID=A0ABP0D2Y7_9PEZI
MLSNSVSTLVPSRLTRVCAQRTQTLVKLGSLAVLPQHNQFQQQIRCFRFHWWANHLDREHRHEIRQRYKAMRHRCSDAGSRKMFREQQHANDADRFTHHYWQPRRCFAFSRYSRYRANNDDVSKSRPSTKSEGGQPGQHIEDVERNAWGHLLFRDGDAVQPTWQSSFDDIRNYLTKRREDLLNEAPFGKAYCKPDTTSTSKSSPSVDPTVDEQFGPEADYVIDPITNRKVSKSSAKSAPVKIEQSLMTGDTSHCAQVFQAEAEPRTKTAPVTDSYLEKAPLSAEVADAGNGNEQVAETQQPKYDDLAKYKPIEYKEPDGKPIDRTVELGHEAYDPEEVAKYKPFHYNEPDGKPATHSAEAGLAGYDEAEMQRYKAFMWNEPHGKPDNQAIELGHEGYDTAVVQSYQTAGSHKSPGQPPKNDVEMRNHEYGTSDVLNYKAFYYNEPDGKATETVEDASDTTEIDLNEKLTAAKPVPSSWYRRKPVSEPDCRKQSTAFTRSALETSMDRINAEHDAIDKLASISVKAATSRLQKQLADAERKQEQHDPNYTEPERLETSYAEDSTVPPIVQSHKRTLAQYLIAETASNSESFVYKILAYNPNTNTLDMAETTSVIPETDSLLSTSEVLLSLSNPAKFFPYFAPLRAQGFEIVSGSDDVLIFRKARDSQSLGSSGSNSTHEKSSPPLNKGAQARTIASATINPIDMTGKKGFVPPSTANFVSPTGYLNLDLPPLHENESFIKADLPPPPTASALPITPGSSISTTSSASPTLANSSSSTQTSATTAAATASPKRFQSGIGVRREEPVFSGAKLGTTGTRKKPSVAKRMILGATWVAGISYVIGVVSEYVKSS